MAAPRPVWEKRRVAVCAKLPAAGGQKQPRGVEVSGESAEGRRVTWYGLAALRSAAGGLGLRWPLQRSARIHSTLLICTRQLGASVLAGQETGHLTKVWGMPKKRPRSCAPWPFSRTSRAS